MIKCPRCGNDNREGRKFCAGCCQSAGAPASSRGLGMVPLMERVLSRREILKA